MTATSTAASSLPPVRTSCHVPLSLMTSISEETIALWLKLGALEKLEQAVLDGYGDQLCGKTSRIPQVNKFLKQVPLFQNKIREIHQAVSQGRLRDVQHLIDRKKLAFCRDHNGASPLHKAVIFGHQDVIEYLVRRYAGSIHIRDHQGRTALHYAAFLPDRGEIYQYLLANGADERAMDVYGRQPSYYLDGQNESTLRQLRDGSTLNGLRKIKPRYYGQVTSGQPFTNSNRPTVTKSQIRELISEGNLNALEDLVLQGQGDRLLGETSTLPKIQSFLNIVPMYMERIYDVHRAVMRDQLEHVVILLENKKLAMARDQLGATPLHKAVLFGHYKIAHYISQQFPDTLNAVDMEGRTALHYAAVLKDNKNMYGILTEAGANKSITDNKAKTADYYAQYPEHLNLDEVIKRCHKVNANYLANTANRIKGKSPVRQTPPPSNGNLSSPRSEENNSSSKDTSQSNDSGNENELMSLLQKDKHLKRLDMSSANIRKWVNAKDMDKLTKAVMEGYGDKVVRVNSNEETEDKEQITGKITEMVDRINVIHSAVANDDLTELQGYLEEKDFALAKDQLGNTPLHKSVLLRKSRIVGYLIEKFPETINAKNKNGLTALHYAAAMSRKDGLQLYKMLLQAGADPKIRDTHGRTPDYYKTHLITLPNKGMMRSRPIASRHSETLNRYSKQGVLERMTAALQRGDVELLQDLVLEGHGKHLLGKASWNDDVKAFLKELPSYLTKIQSLHEATRADDVEKMKEIITSNEKLMRARDENGALPIHIAAASETSEVLQYFAKNYPSVLNTKDATGKTPLHIVSQKGNTTLYKMLKQAGADTKILDQKGKTADYYLHSSKQDGPKTENESSKSSINSSSDSSYSIANVNSNSNSDVSRRRKSNRQKKQNLRDKTKAEVTKAATSAVSINNEDRVTTTESEQNDSENTERRKESLTEAESENILVENEDTENLFGVGDESEENKIDSITENDTEEKDIKNTETEIDVTEENIEANDAEKSEEESEMPSTSNEDADTVIEMNVDKQTNDNDATNEESRSEIKEDNDTGDDNEDINTEADDVAIGATQQEEDENASRNEELKEEKSEGNEDEQTANNEVESEDKADKENLSAEEAFEKVEVVETGEVENTDANIEEENNEDSPKEDVKEENSPPDEEKTEGGIDEIEVHDSGVNDEVDVDVDAVNEDLEDKTTDGSDSKIIENSTEGVTTVAEVGSGKKESVDNVTERNEDHIENQDESAETEESSKLEKEDDNATEDNKDEENEKLVNNDETEGNTTEDIENDALKTEAEKEDDEENAPVNESHNDAVEKTEQENTDSEAINGTIENKDEKMNENEIEPEVSVQNHEQEIENNDFKENTENNEENVINQNDSKTVTQDGTSHHTKDHLDELIEHWIKEGDLLRLEHVVLAGQGDRLIERTSEDKQVQDFLDLVPIYMAKIRAVHEAVAKGQLREVRSVLTRKRFALSRDHVGASPLHLAVLYGHTDVSTYIISHFPETMDGPDNEGRTPLHYAAALHDNGTLYRLLRTAGADENIEDKAGHSPKYYMNYSGNLTLEQLMEPYSGTE